MKKVLIASLIAASALSAKADTNNDVGILVLGAILGAVVSQPRPVVVTQPQVIVTQPQPQVIYQPAYPPIYEYRPYPRTVYCTQVYTAQGQYMGCLR